MSMTPLVPTVHCCMFPGEGRLSGGVLFGERGCLHYFRHRHKKENSLGTVTIMGRVTRGRKGSGGIVWSGGP